MAGVFNSTLRPNSTRFIQHTRRRPRRPWFRRQPNGLGRPGILAVGPRWWPLAKMLQFGPPGAIGRPGASVSNRRSPVGVHRPKTRIPRRSFANLDSIPHIGRSSTRDGDLVVAKVNRLNALQPSGAKESAQNLPLGKLCCLLAILVPAHSRIDEVVVAGQERLTRNDDREDIDDNDEDASTSGRTESREIESLRRVVVSRQEE